MTKPEQESMLELIARHEGFIEQYKHGVLAIDKTNLARMCTALRAAIEWLRAHDLHLVVEDDAREAFRKTLGGG